MSARLALAVALVSTLGTPTVAATSCAWGSEVKAPVEDSPGVPRNTRIWVGNMFWTPMMEAPFGLLVDAGGNEIPFTYTEVGHEIRSEGVMYVLTPDDLLDIGETYTLQGSDFEGEIDALLEFTVEADVDNASPALPVEWDQTIHGPENGPGTWAVNLFLDVEEGGLTFVDEGERSDLDPAEYKGSVTDIRDHSRPGEDQAVLMVGHGIGCSPLESEVRYGGTTTLRYSSYDLAGNFSGWTEPEELVIVGCGCTTEGAGGPAGAGPAVLLVLLAGHFLVGIRRRRA